MILSYERRQLGSIGVIATHGNGCLHHKIVPYLHPLPQRFSADNIAHAVADDANSVVCGKICDEIVQRCSIHKGAVLTAVVFARIEWSIRFTSVPPECGEMALISLLPEPLKRSLAEVDIVVVIHIPAMD